MDHKGERRSVSDGTGLISSTHSPQSASSCQSGDLDRFIVFMELFFWKKAFRDSLQTMQANQYHYFLPLCPNKNKNKNGSLTFFPDSEECLALYRTKAGQTSGWLCSDRFIEHNQTNLIFKHYLLIFWNASQYVRTPADVIYNLIREGGGIILQMNIISDTGTHGLWYGIFSWGNSSSLSDFEQEITMLLFRQAL